VKVDQRWSLGILIALLLAGCGTSRPLMSVPASLEATSDVLTVQRHRWGLGPKPMSFGEWEVVDFRKDRRHRERRRAFGIRPVLYSQTEGTAAYSFVLAANGRDEWECSCEFFSADQDLDIGSPEGRLGQLSVPLTHGESLECELQRVGDDEIWVLRLNGTLNIGGRGYTGTLTNGSQWLALQPRHAIAQFDNVPGPPTGYIFERDGLKVASTELIVPGFVRIGDDAGRDRDVIATAAAALLMQPGQM